MIESACDKDVFISFIIVSPILECYHPSTPRLWPLSPAAAEQTSPPSTRAVKVAEYEDSRQQLTNTQWWQLPSLFFWRSIFFQLLEEIITMVTKSRLKYLETYIALFLGKIISNSETVSTKYKKKKRSKDALASVCTMYIV